MKADESKKRSRSPFSRNVLLGAAVAAVVVVLAAVYIFRSGQSEDASPEPRQFASEFQKFAAFEVIPLSELNLTLWEVADGARIQSDSIEGDVVGAGTVVDLRLAYAESFENSGDGSTSELRHMFLVVEPETLVNEDAETERSSNILIDLPAPPVDAQTGDRGLDELRDSILGSEVAFILTETTPEKAAADDEEIIDAPSGDSGGSIFQPALPSTLIAVDEGSAFPLLTDEELADSRSNIGFLEDVGVEADQFVTSDEMAIP